MGGRNRSDRLHRTDFYVYTYAHPDGTVFYVGKGCKGRIDMHESEARHGHQCNRCNTIRSIWAQGRQVIKRKENDGLSEETAYQVEAQLIDNYGLAVLTNGQGGHKKRRSFPMSPKVVGYIHHSYQKDGMFFDDCEPVYE